MTVPAWLIGDPGRMPFVGHMRLSTRVGDAWLSLSSRVCPGEIAEGWRAARALDAALRTVGERAARQGTGRFSLLRAAWDSLAEVPRDVLGPERGADLSLLMVAGDPTGTAVAGVGLSAVWGRAPGGAWSPLAGEGHPLLSLAGLPTETPGVLELEREVEVVVGCPRPLEPELPAPDLVAERCGVRS